ncbi:uncharacterized protein V6R79_009757 [Siganus canaliculatus]
MAVFFRSDESDVSVEVGEYQEFPHPDDAEDAPIQKTHKHRFRHLSVVLLSFGLLCVLQAVLNISLRLALREPTITVETEAETETETVTETVTEVDTCPRDWITFGSSCYYISTQSRNWDDSRQDCLQRGADLVIINSRQEQAFLTGFTMAAWVGMTDRKKEGVWIWVDGTPVNKDGLQWALGQPDGAYGGEDCGDLHTMINFIGLNDYNCSARIQWICEKTL